MDVPSVEDIQAQTELAALKTASPEKATLNVGIAASSFTKITGQELATVAAADVPLVTYAIRGLAEMVTLQSAPEYLDTLADFDLIQSFNAGPYSETRRNPADAVKARLLVAWPWLSELLWGLLTPDKYDYWIQFFSGQNAPAFEITEVDWSAGQDLLGGSYQSDDHLWGA